MAVAYRDREHHGIHHVSYGSLPLTLVLPRIHGVMYVRYLLSKQGLYDDKICDHIIMCVMCLCLFVHPFPFVLCTVATALKQLSTNAVIALCNACRVLHGRPPLATHVTLCHMGVYVQS